MYDRGSLAGVTIVHGLFMSDIHIRSPGVGAPWYKFEVFVTSLKL